MSENVKVYKSISNVMEAIGKEGISKVRKNQTQNYLFRGIDDVYNALSPILAKNNLCILPCVIERTCEERKTAKGGVLFHVTVKINFDFVSAEDGSRHTITMYGEAMDTADKATNKATSAAYKDACVKTFCIPTEGDNDADAHTPEVIQKKSTISATDGVFESLSSESKKLVTKTVSDILNASGDWGMYEVWSQSNLDHDQRVAVWQLLKHYPSVRSTIKNMQASEQEKQIEINKLKEI